MNKQLALRLLKEGKVTQEQYDKIMDILESPLPAYTPSTFYTPGPPAYGDYGNKA